MFVRYTAQKSFTGVTANTAIVYYDIPMFIKVRGSFDKGLSLYLMNEKLKDNEDKLATPARAIKLAREMFSNVNPKTGRVDVTGNEFYASAIPSGIVNGFITPQKTEDGELMFNGEGTYNVAELLASVGAFIGDNIKPQKTIDNLSYVTDYFNIGYNVCCWGKSSPFFNLYKRNELVNPLTRIELAYILVVCAKVLGSPFTTRYELGVSFDWVRPRNVISKYGDWSKYNISLITENNTMMHDVHLYKQGRSMTDFIADIRSGKSAIPLAMMMSIIELDNQGLWNLFDDVSPLSQVTRGEAVCLFNALKDKEMMK